MQQHRTTPATITRSGVVLPGTTDVRELRVAPATNPNFPSTNPIEVFVRNADGTTTVPVHWFASGAGSWRATDCRSPGAPMSCTFRGSLREPDQTGAAAAIREAFGERGGCVVSLATGGGKTVVALHAACEAARKTLVLVHKDFLVEQWASRIAEFVEGARVSFVRGSTFDTSGDFVVAMIQTLASRAYPASAFEEFGLLMVDECHHVAARTFSKVMFSLALPLTLGLSATPDRRDGLRRVIEWFLGPVVFHTTAKRGMDVRLKTVRYVCETYADPTPTNRRGDACFTSIVSALVADVGRSRRIVDEIRWLAEDRDRDVLVLSHRRAHCVALAALATSSGIRCATYLGGDKTVPTTKVVVSTYALTAEGFDAPRFTGLVLATPASDVTQPIGRVMRGTGTAIVVDIVDSWGMLHAMAAKRRAQYRRAGIGSL